MNKKVIAGLSICTVLALAGVVQHTYASSLCNETEMAGISMMLQNYYNTCVVDSSVNDPEAIVPLDNTGMAGVAVQTETASLPATTSITSSTEVQPKEVPTVNSAEVQVQAGALAATEEALTVDPAAEPAVAPTEAPVSEFANIGISIANEYVNIRRKPDTESKILGKLYRGSAATILETVGEWVKIKSGSVTGYIKSEYLAIGFSAEDLVDKYGTRLATVKTTTLKVREERNTDCAVLTLVPEGEVFEVVKVYDDWVKILVDDSTKGYVSREFVSMSVEFEEAISIEEEQAALKAKQEAEEAAAEAEREEAEARAAEAARSAQAEEAARQAAQSKANSSSNKSNTSNNKSSTPVKSSSNTDTSKVSTGSGSGSDAAAYAQKFVGNRYVSGGTSLTNGTDCSGFAQSVYAKYGVSLPRTSGSQSGSGEKVSIDNVQPGDLIFYAANGNVNHVAIYIGGGQIVHASCVRDGIKISNMKYRTPYTARRVSK